MVEERERLPGTPRLAWRLEYRRIRFRNPEMETSTSDSLPFKPSALLPTLQRRYEEADARTKFALWRRVRVWALDLDRELQDFHAAMRHQVPVLRCAECVHEAIRRSEGQALDLARRELAGLDLTMIWPLLWGIAKDVATYIGGGIVLGGAVGAAVGAFFGGAGAIPGAIGGASVGGEIGTWLLGVIGIKCLIEHIGKAVPEMAEQYSRGFAFAWQAGEADERRTPEISRQMQSATLGFARGHLLLVTAILAAIVLYLSRGAAGRLRLFSELGESRLGPRFAKWVEENEAKLVKHPALQPEKPVTAAMMEGEAAGGGAAKGSGAARPTGKSAGEEAAKARLKFGKDDLVYGPSANGRLVALKNEAGGNLLSDVLRANGKDVYADFGGDWKAASRWAMDQQVQRGGTIRFDLTNVEDLDGVLKGASRANEVTTFELQYLRSNWGTFKDNVVFYRNGQVTAPW